MPRTRRRHVLLAAVLALGAIAATDAAISSTDPLHAVVADIDAGDFRGATSQIDAALAKPGLDDRTRADLEFQRERMRRIRLDFTLSADQARTKLRESIPDLREDEFQRWTKANLLEHMVIDGTPWYFNRSVSNLFRVSPDAMARRAAPFPRNDGPMENANAYHDEAVAEAKRTGKSSVAPRRIHVTQSITVNADAVPAGETVRAWIPYPRALPGRQEDIRFLSSAPAKHQIAPESTLQRTVYLEKPAVQGQPTTFKIDYELTIFGEHHVIDPAKVTPLGDRPDLAPYLAQRPPHIVFTDEMRAFSKKVVGDEKNPYRIAQKLFQAVDDIPWGGAREYSTITNISDYALRGNHADCGQQTLLLMTLLRLNGIPSRWQSGMVYSDGNYDNLHDWGALYLAPYGWVPMDVTTGQFKGARDPEVEWFYLGGLDAYRIAFNDDISTDFVPAKQHVRSETVDSQRGEVEWAGGNLYFDQWDYSFAAKVLPAGGTSR
ncbi:transglutaminase-like domain-containing protein [Lysobacter soli]|uniref:transglutaminase-like domain-containing protein n=1 Tax=Lysobacter soli TaxID=453783 RepID=UPI002410272A|nr:transglutaminase-like domain-containing protein [Lysobacter soli]MDG2519479.1 transglutaminase-like domain-containing protein [Lysobacter soli]